MKQFATSLRSSQNLFSKEHHLMQLVVSQKGYCERSAAIGPAAGMSYERYGFTLSQQQNLPVH
jgi:hypothetical protein